MGLLYNFERLIKKYSADCQLLSESSFGSYVGGEWIPDEAPPSQGITGAVIPMMERKIYQSGGTYTEQDREFINRNSAGAGALYRLRRGKVQGAGKHGLFRLCRLLRLQSEKGGCI